MHKVMLSKQKQMLAKAMNNKVCSTVSFLASFSPLKTAATSKTTTAAPRQSRKASGCPLTGASIAAAALVCCQADTGTAMAAAEAAARGVTPTRGSQPASQAGSRRPPGRRSRTGQKRAEWSKGRQATPALCLRRVFAGDECGTEWDACSPVCLCVRLCVRLPGSTSGWHRGGSIGRQRCRIQSGSQFVAAVAAFTG